MMNDPDDPGGGGILGMFEPADMYDVGDPLLPHCENLYPSATDHANTPFSEAHHATNLMSGNHSTSPQASDHQGLDGDNPRMDFLTMTSSRADHGAGGMDDNHDIGGIHLGMVSPNFSFGSSMFCDEVTHHGDRGFNEGLRATGMSGRDNMRDEIPYLERSGSMDMGHQRFGLLPHSSTDQPFMGQRQSMGVQRPENQGEDLSILDYSTEGGGQLQPFSVLANVRDDFGRSGLETNSLHFMTVMEEDLRVLPPLMHKAMRDEDRGSSHQDTDGALNAPISLHDPMHVLLPHTTWAPSPEADVTNPHTWMLNPAITGLEPMANDAIHIIHGQPTDLCLPNLNSGSVVTVQDIDNRASGIAPMGYAFKGFPSKPDSDFRPDHSPARPVLVVKGEVRLSSQGEPQHKAGPRTRIKNQEPSTQQSTTKGGNKKKGTKHQHQGGTVTDDSNNNNNNNNNNKQATNNKQQARQGCRHTKRNQDESEAATKVTNYDKFPDDMLRDWKVQDLNRELKGLPKDLRIKVKKERRTLKNRVYAHNSRHKKNSELRDCKDELARVRSCNEKLEVDCNFLMKNLAKHKELMLKALEGWKSLSGSCADVACGAQRRFVEDLMSEMREELMVFDANDFHVGNGCLQQQQGEDPAPGGFKQLYLMREEGVDVERCGGSLMRANNGFHDRFLTEDSNDMEGY